MQDHFNEDQIEANRQDGRKMLKWNAIPCKKRQTNCKCILPSAKRMKQAVLVPTQVNSSVKSSNAYSSGINVYASEDFQCVQPSASVTRTKAVVLPKGNFCVSVCHDIVQPCEVFDQQYEQPHAKPVDTVRQVNSNHGFAFACTNRHCQTVVNELKRKIRQLERQVISNILINLFLTR